MAGERPDYDQTLKRLLTQAHDGLLALLLPEARWLGEVPSELPGGMRQADLVWQVALRSGEAVLLHVELQTWPEAAMGERMAEYTLRLWLQNHLPVHSVVVYLRETSEHLPDTFVVPRGGGEGALHCRFDVVRLWEVPAEAVLARPEPALWPLAALMAGAIVETVTAVVERLGQAGLSRHEQGELTGLLAVLAGARLPGDVVIQIVRRHPMLRELIEESSYTQLVREEAEALGRAEGLARMRELVQAVLERRFGVLAADELAALGRADTPLLQEIAPQALDDTREQMRARLGLTSPI